MDFIDLEEGRRWADYSDEEPLPEIVFGVKMESAPVLKEEDGWQVVKKKDKKPPKKSEIRRPAWIR